MGRAFRIRDRFDELNDALIAAKQQGMVGDWCYQYNHRQREPWGIRINETTMTMQEAPTWLANLVARTTKP